MRIFVFIPSGREVTDIGFVLVGGVGVVVADLLVVTATFLLDVDRVRRRDGLEGSLLLANGVENSFGFLLEGASCSVTAGVEGTDGAGIADAGAVARADCIASVSDSEVGSFTCMMPTTRKKKATTSQSLSGSFDFNAAGKRSSFTCDASQSALKV